MLTNSSFKILPELHFQNLDQTMYPKSEQKFSFMTKPQLLNPQQSLNKLLSTGSSSSTSATVEISSFELASSKNQGHIN